MSRGAGTVMLVFAALGVNLATGRVGGHPHQELTAERSHILTLKT